MKDILRQERGVSLISLAAVIIVIGIITTMLLYNISDTDDVSKLTNLYNDIDNLEDRISNYYSLYGKIPAIPVEKLSGVNDVINSLSDSPVGANDIGNYLVIDLRAIENLTLNYGKDYENFKNIQENGNSIGEFRDLYVINENSHNVFYLKGIRIKEGKTYYTKNDTDIEKVNLRYVDGIKIYDGYNYSSGNKRSGIKIRRSGAENDPNTEYTWINVENQIFNINELSQNVTVEANNITKFINSVNEYSGYYFNEHINENAGANSRVTDVLYFQVDETSEDSWSLKYDKEGTYKDKNGKIAYIPKGFQVSKLSSLNTINKGLVIRNAENINQQYVWIEVPKVAFENNGETATTLEELEENLKEYVSPYREEGYLDSYYEGSIGANKIQEYNELKNKMYQSIKDKGGFWISRDELGEAKSYEAYAEVSSVQIEGRNSSLLFGIQWDLVCKYLENVQADANNNLLNIKNLTGNGEITIESIRENSETNAVGNKTVLRNALSKDRSVIPYSQSSYYRATIF